MSDSRHKSSRLTREAKIRWMRARYGKNPFRIRPEKPEHQHLRKRQARERRFRLYGALAVAISLGFLVMLLYSIISHGSSAFRQTEIRLDINFAAETLDPQGARDAAALRAADYTKLIRDALKARFLEVEDRDKKFQLYALLSKGADTVLRDKVLEDPALIGTTQPVWLPASSDADMFVKEHITRATPEEQRRFKDTQIGWLDALAKDGAVKTGFNTGFFTQGDSREPEQAGVKGAVVGSLFTIFVCILAAFPVGVGAAVYLEEFAPKNKFADIIEININNLAAVPSIIFGLLALDVYLGTFGMPRSSALVGGLTLALLVLPVIVITTRTSLKSVPQSIRHAAIAMGATKVQTTLHHTLPYALPGIMTGTILSLARALGETAPLLMIGMVAFVADTPHGLTSPATALPVQIYLWSDSAEMGFVEKTSGCILVLLGFLAGVNALAVYLRRKFSYTW